MLTLGHLPLEGKRYQHFEEENKAADAQRDRYFAQEGIEVLRIPNNAVKENFAGVCAEISGKLEGV